MRYAKVNKRHGQLYYAGTVTQFPLHAGEKRKPKIVPTVKRGAMNVYIWDGWHSDWTDGVLAVLAPTLKVARDTAAKKFPNDRNFIHVNKPQVIRVASSQEPRVIISVAGGS